MTKFKIGDKVVCVDNNAAEYRFSIGDEFTITGIREGYEIEEYMLDGERLSWCGWRFELVEDEESTRKADNETELALAKDQIASLQQALKQAKELLRVSYHTTDSSLHMKKIKEFLGEDE